MKFYKCCNVCDSLVQGHTYHTGGPRKGSKLVQLTDSLSGRVTSLYPWQITQALASGALVELNTSHSAAMSAPVVGTVCRQTQTGFIY